MSDRERERPADDDELVGEFRRLDAFFVEEGGRRKRRAQRRKRVRRALVVPLAGAVALGGGAAATGRLDFIGDGGTTKPDPGVPLETKPAPPGAPTGVAVTRDPDPKEKAPWGMGYYKNLEPGEEHGKTCLLAGRLHDDGALGRLMNGQFVRYDSTFPGGCDWYGAKHAVFATRSYGKATGSRSILWGVVDRAVANVSLGLPDAWRPITVETDGTFIVVAAGDTALRGKVFRIALKGGGGSEYPLQVSPGPLRPAGG